MYERMLVPTDGSTASEGATEHAVDLAKQYGATLHVLYVVDTGAYTSLEVGAEVVADELEEEGEKSVQAVARRAEDAGVEVVTEVRNGVAHRSIVDYVDDEDIDLVVMGTHGRTGVDRVLLGSVAEKVVRTANAPVLTVRSDYGSEAAEE